ncbi:MAG: Uma2 family endonuclease, partial [Planctomycetaceae bacterium]
MNGAASMTAGEFLECRYELPEAGQWSELEAGELVHLQPPDLDHGTVILNLSKAFAEHAQGTRQGYACFDLGLQLTSAPDTVRFPAACYFDAGPRFAESDRQITSTVPALVVELASTADRLRLQPERSHAFLDWGSARCGR